MILTAITMRGMCLADLDHLTIGQAVDFVITYNNAVSGSGAEEEKEIRATQADFDRF